MQFFNINASKPADATEAHAASAPEVPCALGCPKKQCALGSAHAPSTNIPSQCPRHPCLFTCHMTLVSRNLCQAKRTFIVSRSPINIKQDLCFVSSHQTDKNGDKTGMFLNTHTSCTFCSIISQLSD